MIKKTYYISGFDCPNCAAKTERFLSTQNDVEFVHIDFAANRLYITYKNDAWTLKQLTNKIKEVESDPLNISETKENVNDIINYNNTNITTEFISGSASDNACQNGDGACIVNYLMKITWQECLKAKVL